MEANIELNTGIKLRLEKLNDDHESVTGQRFENFVCPILYADEPVELCHAHIINQKFSNSDRSRTVQRADVDSLFGTLFEGEFVLLEKKGQPVIADALTDPNLAKKVGLKLVSGDMPVDHYPKKGHDATPDDHTLIDFYNNEDKVGLFGIKMSPDELLSRSDKGWQFQVDKNLQLPSLISGLKAAHLTMFHLWGYRYALSVGGRFLGKSILGDYVLKVRGLGRSDAIEAAADHFNEFAALMRPIVSPLPEYDGTVSDGKFYLLMNGSAFWAIQVVVRTAEHKHAVIVPIFDDIECVAYFFDFLKSPARDLQVKPARFKCDKIEGTKDSMTMAWPEAQMDLTASAL